MADNEEKFSVDTEQLKSETKETVNQVKDSIKNVNLKKDAAETKGFLIEMFSDPISAVKRVASGEENVLSKVIVLMIVWIAASVACGVISLFRYSKYASIGNNLLNFISYALSPILCILVPSIVILIMNKKNKKSLITVISALTIAEVPTILSRIIDVLETLVSKITNITGPISTMLTAVAFVLTYFAMKELFEEEEDKSMIKTFAIVELIASFAFILLKLAGIY